MFTSALERPIASATDAGLVHSGKAAPTEATRMGCWLWHAAMARSR